MIGSVSRRRFLQGTTAAGLAGAGLGMGMRPAHAVDQLLVVQWGAMWIEVSKEIVKEYEPKNDARIAWELHSGGAAAVVAKIKASWPRTQYNVVSAWDPVFRAMINEGWLEPVTYDEVPNLKDIPPAFIQKDAQGRMMNVPLSTAGAWWGYRKDLLDKPFRTVEELLEPRFKGKIVVPFPVNLTGLSMVSLAMARGGNERNIEPGWDFIKELARRGNIGRVTNNNSEFINAMSSGEVSVGFWNSGGWFAILQRFPTQIMNRMPDNKGFLFNEGFCILKTGKEAAGKKFANHFAGAEVNSKYNMPLGSGPANPKAKPNPILEGIFYKPEELEKHAYIPDYTYLASQVDAWAKRWETEVVPLLRG
jgi:putative spermidine/putrescine transport system substrate-binding protein